MHASHVGEIVEMTTETKHEAAAKDPSVDVDMTEEVADDDATVTYLEDEATEVLAKARYDAFRLVTEARKEAETILDQAREEAAEITREAELKAESILDAARVQASEIRSSEPVDTEDVTEEAVAELEAEHRQLTDQVGSLRALADQLEQRFAALAAHAESPPAAPSATPHHEGSAPSAEPAGPTLDYSPSVPAPSRAEALAEKEHDGEEAEEERGSFYSRRSAKLPRIGEAGGKSALDMMRSIRETLDDQ